MGSLWVLMTDLYGHKWTSSHGLSDASGNWGRALAGITHEQIAIGAQACALSGAAWPPSAPEFRAMCTEGKSGLQIPDPDCAWREAVLASSDLINWKFSHPIVMEAGRLTDWISIRTGRPAAEQVRARFVKRYAELTTKLARGESMVSGQLAIEAAATRTQAAESDLANERLVLQRIRDQGLHKKTPEQIRAELFEKLGIKRKAESRKEKNQ